MGDNTGIGWAHFPGLKGASWNMFKARNNETGRLGHICVPHGPGCLNCYAERMNERGQMYGKPMGNQLAFTYENLKRVTLELMHDEGQTSIEWPLRSKASHSIFPCSMTDWLADFYPMPWILHLLGVMMVAQHHVFLPLTKRWDHVVMLLNAISARKGITLPDGKVYDIAILKARGNEKQWAGGKTMVQIRNSTQSAMVPWPPPNILFGFTAVNQNEARELVQHLQKIKELDPGFRTWVSYEPALETVDWSALYYNKLIDWLVVGGESDGGEGVARAMPIEAVTSSVNFGKTHGIPVYMKQFGTVLAKEYGLKGKGENDGTIVFQAKEAGDIMELPREFPNIKDAYIPWKK